MPGARVTIDAEWLRVAYITQGLSLSAMSAESGVTISTLHRRLKVHGIIGPP
jgi:transcriptional regulator of acetoin/glycerol metabolism